MSEDQAEDQTEDQIELPKYKCTKNVQALKIASIVFDRDLAMDENRETDGTAVITPAEEGYEPFKVDRQYVRKHAPVVGGYFVLFEDGYQSFSPAEPFEKGYEKA